MEGGNQKGTVDPREGSGGFTESFRGGHGSFLGIKGFIMRSRVYSSISGK